MSGKTLKIMKTRTCWVGDKCCINLDSELPKFVKIASTFYVMMRIEEKKIFTFK